MPYSEPAVRLLLALHGQHQCVPVGQREAELVVLPLAVFGRVHHRALGQQQVHIGARVLGTLIALKKKSQLKG